MRSADIEGCDVAAPGRPDDIASAVIGGLVPQRGLAAAWNFHTFGSGALVVSVRHCITAHRTMSGLTDRAVGKPWPQQRGVVLPSSAAAQLCQGSQGIAANVRVIAKRGKARIGR